MLINISGASGVARGLIVMIKTGYNGEELYTVLIGKKQCNK